ncbi:hypothetical protein LXL04_015443 [Taraxacum kok-saghyz]
MPFPFLIKRRLGCWIRDPRSRLDQHPTERGQSLEATGWETKRTLGLFLSSSRPMSRSSTKRGISIMDPKPLTPSSLGLRALGKGSSDGKPATSYKAPISNLTNFTKPIDLDTLRTPVTIGQSQTKQRPIDNLRRPSEEFVQIDNDQFDNLPLRTEFCCESSTYS